MLDFLIRTGAGAVHRCRTDATDAGTAMDREGLGDSEGDMLLSLIEEIHSQLSLLARYGLRITLPAASNTVLGHRRRMPPLDE